MKQDLELFNRMIYLLTGFRMLESEIINHFKKFIVIKPMEFQYHPIPYLLIPCFLKLAKEKISEMQKTITYILLPEDLTKVVLITLFQSGDRHNLIKRLRL